MSYVPFWDVAYQGDVERMREIITNDEHFVETAAKLRVSVALPLPSTRPAE